MDGSLKTAEEVVNVALRRRKDSGAWEVAVARDGQLPLRESNKDWSRIDALRRELQLTEDATITAPHTLAEAIDKWEGEYVPHLRNLRSYDTQARSLRQVAGSRPIRDAVSIATEIRKTKGLKPGTINRRLALLRRLVNLAYDEWEWLDKPLGRKIKQLSERGNERHIYLTRAQVEDLAAKCHNRDVGDLIVFAAFTGLRLSELERVVAGHIVNGVLYVDAKTKNGKPRSIPLHPRALTIGQRLPFDVPQRMRVEIWTAARERCNLSHVHWHDLRHTFASWLLQSGASLVEVKELMGHSTINVTMRYAHLAPDSLTRAIARLEP